MTPTEFRRLREDELGMTQQHVADLFGFSESHIRNIETGRAGDTVRGCFALAMQQLVMLKRHDAGPFDDTR